MSWWDLPVFDPGPYITEHVIGPITQDENQIKEWVFMISIPYPKEIVYDPINKATIVYWTDETKTVVRLAEGDCHDPYMAFCAAVTKKLYGTNSRTKRIIKEKSRFKKLKPMPKKATDSTVKT